MRRGFAAALILVSLISLNAADDRDTVFQSIESRRATYAGIAKQIWSFAEVGYQEQTTVFLTCVLAALTSENLSSQASPQRSSPEGLALLHKLQDALGGAKQIAEVRDFEETILAQAWDSRGTALGDVRKRTRWMRNPNVVRLDQRGPRGTYVLFLDGRTWSGWEILPDLKSLDPYRTTGAAIDLTGGELEFAKGYLSGFELNQWLADQMPGYRVTSPTAAVLRIEHDDKATDFTLDPVTSLPMKSGGVSLADPDHPVPSEMRYEKWKEVSGVRFPSHRVNYMSGMKRGEVTTSDIRVNAGLRVEDLSAKPANSAPDLPGR
jgi:hypothetical protein